jgi:hypothetical protein
VLCVFFKAGQCEKGTKCKFSHDPDVGRKVEKKNLYQDSREEKMAGLCLLTAMRVLILIIPGGANTMDKWDDEKLAQVILSKAGNPRTTTDVRIQVFYCGQVQRDNTNPSDCLQTFYPGDRISSIRILSFAS